jgi:hypothetical protein
MPEVGVKMGDETDLRGKHATVWDCEMGVGGNGWMCCAPITHGEDPDQGDNVSWPVRLYRDGSLPIREAFLVPTRAPCQGRLADNQGSELAGPRPFSHSTDGWE